MKADLISRIDHNHAHHPPQTAERIAAHEMVREATAECAKRLVELCPEGRELSLALTAMEEAMSWSHAAIARGE